MSQNTETVSDRLDHLTSILNQFMSDMDDPRTHASRLSVISSVHQSFCDGSVLATEDDEDFEVPYIPSEVFSKIEEFLTEIDRLNMKAEDYRAQLMRWEEKEVEIFLSMNQIKNLHRRLGEVIASKNEETVFRLNRNSLVNCDFCLTCCDLPERLTSLEVECQKLKSESHDFLSQIIQDHHSSSEPRENSSNSENISIPTETRELFLKSIELHKESIKLKHKELELDKQREDLGSLMIKAEVLIAEYQEKNEEILRVKRRETHKKHPSQDVTRTRTPVPLGTLSTSCFIMDLLNTRTEIHTKLMNMEKIIKEKYKKNKQTAKIENLENFLDDYRQKDATFQKNLENIRNVQQKERFLMAYLKESRDFLQQIIEELQKYERFLVDNWIKANGKPSGIDAAKKASSMFFQKLMEFKKKSEILDEKYLRIVKIRDIVKKENEKLQNNRKKILAERNNLQKQQMKIENYYKSLTSLNSTHGPSLIKYIAD
jgi:hypothetical protein